MNFMQLIRRLEAAEQAVKDLKERVEALEKPEIDYVPAPEDPAIGVAVRRGPGRPRKING